MLVPFIFPSVLVKPAYGVCYIVIITMAPSASVCACAHSCTRLSVQICPDHNDYIYAWISKSYRTIVFLMSRCFILRFYLDSSKVKVKWA